MHVYIDESRRGDRYLVTAVFVPSNQVVAVRKFVSSFVMTGASRVHFTAESDNRRRKFLTELEAIAIDGCTCLSLVNGGGDDQPAREQCLETMFPHVAEKKVSRMVLDQRSPDRDSLDRSCVERAIRGGTLSAELEYRHMNSRDEMLLGLPDAIGWSIGQGGWAREAALKLPTIELAVDGPPTVDRRHTSRRKRTNRKRRR